MQTKKQQRRLRKKTRRGGMLKMLKNTVSRKQKTPPPSDKELERLQSIVFDEIELDEQRKMKKTKTRKLRKNAKKAEKLRIKEIMEQEPKMAFVDNSSSSSSDDDSINDLDNIEFDEDKIDAQKIRRKQAKKEFEKTVKEIGWECVSSSDEEEIVCRKRKSR